MAMFCHLVCFCAALSSSNLDDGAIGHDGRDFGSADLNGFLHDEVHVFPFRNRLSKGDAAGKRRGRRFVQSAETNLGAIDGDDLGGNLAAVAVEEDKLCAGLEPENIAGVMGFAAAQQRCVGIPFVRREIEAMHANYNEHQIPSTREAPSTEASNPKMWRATLVIAISLGFGFSETWNREIPVSRSSEYRCRERRRGPANVPVPAR